MNHTYEIYIGGSVEQVWNVLMSPTETPKIYYGSVLKSTFEMGSPFNYVGPGVAGNETIHVYGKVLEFKPNKVFSHTCKIGDAYGAEHAKFESRVTYTLEPMGSCTKLTVTHDQWKEGDPSYENTIKNGGWTKLLCCVKTLVETGKPLELNVHSNEK